MLLDNHAFAHLSSSQDAVSVLEENGSSNHCETSKGSALPYPPRCVAVDDVLRNTSGVKPVSASIYSPNPAQCCRWGERVSIKGVHVEWACRADGGEENKNLDMSTPLPYSHERSRMMRRQSDAIHFTRDIVLAGQGGGGHSARTM